MATTKLVLVLTLCPLLSWVRCSVEAETACEFSIPSSHQQGACDHYNLTGYLTDQPFNLTLSKDDYNYSVTFGFCQSFTAPKQCSSVKAGMAAYAYNGDSCYGLGSNAKTSTFAVSLLAANFFFTSALCYF